MCCDSIFVWIMCLIKNVEVSKTLPSGSTSFSYNLHKIIHIFQINFIYFYNEATSYWNVLDAQCSMAVKMEREKIISTKRKSLICKGERNEPS